MSSNGNQHSLFPAFDINATYVDIVNKAPERVGRPLIGITGNWGDKGCELGDGYYKSIEAAGAVPLIIPPTEDKAVLLGVLERVDGILFSGGADVNPLFVGEEPCCALGGINARRDKGELLLARLAYDRQMPILGICRGIQVLAMALGGSIHQDIYSASADDVALLRPLLKHSQNAPRGTATHTVVAEKKSRVANLLGERFAVNSFHHQAVKSAGEHLKVTARATDGVIEALESTEEQYIVGVQWHPECFLLDGDESMLPLFCDFVAAADLFRKARKLHRTILTLDSHCDTPMKFGQGVDFCRRDPNLLVDYPKMCEGGLDASVVVAYLAQEGRSEEELLKATAKADRILMEIEAMVMRCRGAALAVCPDDLYRNKLLGKKSILRGIENGYALGSDISNVERYRRQGVVYITLCHNGDNDLCDSACKSRNEHGGLSTFGKAVVAEMNRVGLMVDLSHAAETSFYDALQTSKLPIVCSHSSARALCNHPRNLTDDQLKALAAAGGVAQMTMYHGFLREEGMATVDDAVRHLLRMISVAGINAVGIGTDFDGDGGVLGCASAAHLHNLTMRLLAEGLTVEDLQKIWGGNFLRVMAQVQAAAEI